VGRLPYVRGAVIVVLGTDASTTIAREAPASADRCETGGILLGHDLGHRLSVTVAGGPGPNADRRCDGFLRDLDHARRVGDAAYERDGSVWVGEWHTHPGGPMSPSPTDMRTYARLLADPELGFNRVLSLIATQCPVHGWEETSLTGWIVDETGAHLTDIAVEGTAHLRHREAW